ncbi:MAG TPA: RNA polymerase sigma factor RpoH [Stellaceae bacterium]|nr:RNA polymerase sigma factor RpoH [Stellaceae bacterium]
MKRVFASIEPWLARYLAEIARTPMLDEPEEYRLATQYRTQGDRAAADRLVTSHLRLVAKIALGYRGYGLPLADLIAEGGVGLVKAVDRFDPERGFRLSSYARWWIRAEIHEYVLASWSLVKLGTTAAQKKLFFNLRRLKAQLQEFDSGISPEATRKIASVLEVSETEVVQMNGRLAARQISLNAAIGDDEESDWEDRLADDSEDQETALVRCDELRHRRENLAIALSQLAPRAQEIIRARYLRDEPVPLAILANRYGITPQRVRQIEDDAVRKLRARLQQLPRALLAPMPRAA